MKDLLYEKIIDDINNLIVENLSISNELSKSAYKVIDEIEKDIKITRAQLINIKGVTYKTNTVSINIEAIKQVVNITYYYYNFMTEILKRQGIGRIKSQNQVDENSITITIISVANKIDTNTLHDSIYHELEHMYQLSKRGKSFIENRNDIYYHAHDLMHSLQPNTLGYMIAACLYLSETFEQDAYVNGMYGAVMNRVKNFWDIMKEFKNTSAYNGIKSFEQYLNLIKTYRDETIQTLNTYFYEYNISYDDMIKYFEDRLKRFETKIGKVITKMQEDYKEQHEDRVKLPPKISFT